jgi:hypothetical protein
MKLHTTRLPGHCAMAAGGAGKGSLTTNNESSLCSQNHPDECELQETSTDCDWSHHGPFQLAFLDKKF